MAAPGSRRAVLLSDELQCTRGPGFLCAYLCSISLLICQAPLQQLSRTLSGTNAWQLQPETSSCCRLSPCRLHGPAGRETGSWHVPHPLGTDPRGWGQATSILMRQGRTSHRGGQGSPGAASLLSQEDRNVNPGRDTEPVISLGPVAHGGSRCPLASLPFPPPMAPASLASGP